MSFHPLRLLMPGGRLARHQVLLFHRVLPSRDPMMPWEPDVEWFDRLIARLERVFSIIPLRQAIELAQQGRLPAASLSLTFDDGYADNFTCALPVLERHGAHATFFIASGFLDGGRMFNDTLIETARRVPTGEIVYPFTAGETLVIDSMEDRRKLAERAIGDCKYLPVAERDDRVARFAALQQDPLPDSLMMTSDQLQQLHASRCADIGAHTVTHPILAVCDDDLASDEINRSVQDLERLTGEKPRLFAYPNGKQGKDYLAGQARLVENAGLDAAVSTEWGVLGNATDRYQVPRFSPWSQNLNRYVLDLLRARYGLI